MGAKAKRQWGLSQYEGFLTPLLFSFTAGSAMAYVLSESPFLNLTFLLPLLVLLAGLIAWSERRWVIQGVFFLLAFLVGGFYFHQMSFHPGPQDISQWAYQDHVEVKGILLESQAEKHQAQLQVLAVNRRPAEGKLLFQTGSARLPGLGATLLLKGSLFPPRESQTPGGFDQKRYLLTQKITAVLRHLEILQVLAPEPSTWEGRFLRIVEETRQGISVLFKRTLPSPESEVLGGIVLGDHAIPVDSATRQQFIHTGLIHVLAASGMNVAIVAAFILWLGQFLRLPFRFRLLLAMSGVAIYALLTGLPPSIQRAGAMLELALLLKLIDKQMSPVGLLSVAVFLLVLVNPDAIGSLGFQFSVLTTFGLVTMAAPLQEWLGFYITRWLSGLVVVPLVAQLWVLPLSLYFFNQFPLHSVPLNIGALAMVAPLTAIGFTAGFLSLVWKPLGAWVSLTAWPFLKGLLWVVGLGDQMTWAQWTLPSPAPLTVFIQYLCLLGAAIVLTRLKAWPSSRKAIALMGCVVLAILPLALERFWESSETTLTLLPLPSHQTAYVIEPQGSPQAIIAMAADSGYWQGRAVLDYCRHRGFKPLKGLLLLPGEGASLGAGVQKLLKSPYLAPGETSVFRLAPGELLESEPLQGFRDVPLLPSQGMQLGNLQLLYTSLSPEPTLQVLLPNLCFSLRPAAHAVEGCSAGRSPFPRFRANQYAHFSLKGEHLMIRTMF